MTEQTSDDPKVVDLRRLKLRTAYRCSGCTELHHVIPDKALDESGVFTLRPTFQLLCNLTGRSETHVLSQVRVVYDP